MPEGQPDPLIGQKLDRFQVIDYLGAIARKDHLGYRWYKAFDTKFDRTVALLVVKLPTSPDNLGDTLAKQGRQLLTWRHSGIARVLDIGQSGDKIYLAREFLPGADLGTLLARLRAGQRCITLPEATKMVHEISLALDYAHQRGVVISNLRPEAVFFRLEPFEGLPYQPVLIEAGLTPPDLPIDNSTISVYSAPEVRRAEKTDSRSDIYSLGIMLYEMATGQLPAGPKSSSADQSRVNESPDTAPLPPSMLRPDLPVKLEKAILRAIAINPADRFSNIAELTHALEEAWPQASKVLTPPPGFDASESLLPILQESLKERANAPLSPMAIPTSAPPGTAQASPTDQAGSPPVTQADTDKKASPSDQDSAIDDTLPVVDISQDRIHILEPNQSVHSIPMKLEGLIIGRSKDSDIQLDYPGISRHHTRIDFDGLNYNVTDLKSLNGTFLEDKRLPTNTPAPWQPGENLRIGETWLRLERAGQTQTTVATATQVSQTGTRTLADTEVMYIAPDGQSIDPSLIKLSPAPGWVGVYLDPLNLSVSPGNTVNTTLVLFNRGPAADVLSVSISGIPNDWLLTSLQPQRLAPGGRQEVSLAFSPRRSPESRAGRHAVTIRVASTNSPPQTVEIRLSLTITAYSQFSTEMKPRQIHSGEIGQIIVHNRGNLPETFALSLEDTGGDAFREAQLAFDPPGLKVSIPEGKSAAIEFRTALIRPRWLGGEMFHPFSVHVASQAGQRQSASGEFVSRGVIPVWAPVVLASLCILLTCMMLIFYNQFTAPARYAQQTAAANQTAIALFSSQTAQANTATANALAGANQATIDAATATAGWLILDDDRDGLSNNDEIIANTRPDLPDTDQDGLSDGDEKNTWHSDPLKSDTDGDGLRDGEEVQRGLNPIQKDTDGDGLDDAVDPDPLRPPTKTALVIPSFTPTPPGATPTHTHTPTATTPPPPNVVDLTVSMNNGQPTSVPGSTIAYTILITNKGPAVANNVRVSDAFPGSLTNITWTCTASTGSACPSPNGIGNIDLGVNLAVNGTVTFIASGKLSPTASGLLINSSTVAAPPGLSEFNVVDNLAVDTDTLTPKVSLAFSKTDNKDTIAPGQATSYIIQVKNNGPSAVSGVTINDTFPDKLTGITWTCNATPGSGCAANGVQNGNINTAVNLAFDGSATINVNATLKTSATGTLSNSAFLTSPIDPSTNNKTATDNTAIVPVADLELSVSGPLTTTTSTVVTYTVQITNTGPSPASNIVINYNLPASVNFVNSDPGAPTCYLQSPKVVCTLSSLSVGATSAYKIAIMTPGSPGIIAPAVDVKADEADPNPANNQVTNNITVQ